MTDWLLPFLCGLGAAVISAWGVGGGTLLLLVMTLFLGVDQRTAQGINLLFFLPTAISALLCHWREGYLDVPTWKAAVPVAVPAALAGAWIATAVDVDLLRRPFGIYLLLSGLSLISPKRIIKPPAAEYSRRGSFVSFRGDHFSTASVSSSVTVRISPRRQRVNVISSPTWCCHRARSRSALLRVSLPSAARR